MIAPKRQQRAPSPQQRRVPSSQPALDSRWYGPTEPPNAVILSSVSITTATWLVIGGVAFGNKAVAESEGAGVVIILCCIVYSFAAMTTLFGLDLQYEGSLGPAWMSGMLGLGIGGFYAISASEAMDCGVLFRTLGGMQAGWLIEWALHPVGRFLGHHTYPYTSAPLQVQAAMAPARQDGAPGTAGDTTQTPEGPIRA